MSNFTNEEKLNLFKETFKGRDDVYGAGAGMCVKEPVTNEVFKGHLTGKKRIGRYPLSPTILDGAGTWWVAGDLDDDDIELVIRFCEPLEHLGIPCYIERSKSKGYHPWIFFSAPVEAAKARALMQYANDILERDIGFQIKEIFPKQNTIKQSDGSYGFGNYINLPLFGADVPKGRTVFLNPDDRYKPYTDQWPFLKSIERVTPEKLNELIEMGELEPREESDALSHFEEQADNDKESVFGDDESTSGEGTTEEYNDMLPCVPTMMQGVSEGCRDVVAFTLAKHFRVEKKLPQEAVLAILRTWNQKNAPPLSDKDLQIKIKSAYTGKGGKGYSSLGCDDDLIKPFCNKDECPVFKQEKKKKKSKEDFSPYFLGDAFIPKRLADDILKDNRFIYAGEQLYRYDSGVYRADGERFVEMEAQKRLSDESRQHRIAEVVYYIQVDSYTPTEKLNTKPSLINLENGLFDWIEGTLLPHNPDYLSTIRIPVIYNPQATCPTVDYFFESTLPPDCVPIADELFGYVLIPYVRFEKAFMFTGSGSNGKSTFLTLLEKFTGSENTSKIPLQELDEHRFKRAELFGKLINLFADLDARRLDSSTYFKTIVSGDAIDAERKHKDPFSFRPFARLVYSANELPQSPDKTHAYYRRWCIIPFPNRFEGKKADKSLAEKLTKEDELSGLLNRALKGLNRLFEQEGFTESVTVIDALEEYKRQNDTVAAFVSECCLFESNAEIERGEFYNAYTTYCEKEGYKAVSRIACYNRIRAYPQVGEKKEPATRYFTGIKVKKSQ